MRSAAKRSPNSAGFENQSEPKSATDTLRDATRREAGSDTQKTHGGAHRKTQHTLTHAHSLTHTHTHTPTHAHTQALTHTRTRTQTPSAVCSGRVGEREVQ